MTKQRVLIIGGNRFIGKYLAEWLNEELYDITVLNRTGTGPADVTIIKGDRDNVSEIKHKLMFHGPFDIIIDMCCYKLRQIKQLENSLPNTLPTKYIFMSTLATNNGGQYGIDKLQVESYLIKKSKLNYTIIKPGYIIGFGDPHNRLETYVSCLLNNKQIPMPVDPNQSIIITDYFELVHKIIAIVEGKIDTKYFIPTCYKTSPNEIVTIISENLKKPIRQKTAIAAPFELELHHERALNDLQELKELIEYYI